MLEAKEGRGVSGGVSIVGKEKDWRIASAPQRDKGRIGCNEGRGNVRLRLKWWCTKKGGNVKKLWCVCDRQVTLV